MVMRLSKVRKTMERGNKSWITAAQWVKTTGSCKLWGKFYVICSVLERRKDAMALFFHSNDTSTEQQTDGGVITKCETQKRIKWEPLCLRCLCCEILSVVTCQKNASITTGWDKHRYLTSETECLTCPTMGWGSTPWSRAGPGTGQGEGYSSTTADPCLGVGISPGIKLLAGVFMQILSSGALERCQATE